MKFKKGDLIRIREGVDWHAAAVDWHAAALDNNLYEWDLHDLFDNGRTQKVAGLDSVSKTVCIGPWDVWVDVWVKEEYFELADTPRKEDKPEWAERWAQLMK